MLARVLLFKLGLLALASLWTPDHTLVALCLWKMFRLWGWLVAAPACVCYAALRARGQL